MEFSFLGLGREDVVKLNYSTISNGKACWGLFNAT